MDSIRKLLSRKFDNHLFENGRSPGLRLVGGLPIVKKRQWHEVATSISNN